MTRWLFEGGEKKEKLIRLNHLYVFVVHQLSVIVLSLLNCPFNHTTWTRGGASLLEYILTFGKLPKW